MRFPKQLYLILFAVLFSQFASAQHGDSLKQVSSFSGAVGITNNGISIIPSFSLNSPAYTALLSWKKGRFSFDPDIRLNYQFKKGGMIFWLRYQLVQNKRFKLRIGAHPALNLMPRVVNDSPDPSIIQARRFIATEVAPNINLTKDWSVGVYYLHGNGLQKDGPLSTHYIMMNTNISNINLGNDFRFQVMPSFYYLNVDGNDGTYLAAMATLSNRKSPFILQSTLNQTIKSNIPNNKDFMWNVTLSYTFNRIYRREK